MSTYTIVRDEPVYIQKQVFCSGLSTIAFRVYCQICFISQQVEAEEEHINLDCGISEEQLATAYRELESFGFIQLINNQIRILDLTKRKSVPPDRIPSPKEFCKSPELYQSIPLRGRSVYVIRNPINRLVKIGISSSPRIRIKAIANRHKTDVITLFIIPTHKNENLEKYLHDRFDSKQVDFAGEKEWFSLDDNDLSFFSSPELKSIISRIEGEIHDEAMPEIVEDINER